MGWAAIARKLGESIAIGHDVHVTVVSVTGGRVTLFVQSPDDTQVDRLPKKPLDKSQPDSIPSQA